MQPAIQISHVGMNFVSDSGVTEALRDVTLRVDDGEFLTVVGASGCGKSTLLNLIAGIDVPTSGNIVVSHKTALMFQDATLLPWLTARGNVELALKLIGMNKRERRSHAQELLDVVRLGQWADKRPHELSGGMRQRVALARCLAQDARIVLMDEPLGALDAMTRDHLHDEIEAIVKERKLTVVFVTHNMREAVRLGDRVVLMGSNPGRIVHIQEVDLPHPRIMDSTAVAMRAAALTSRLKAQQPHLIGADS